MTLRSAIGKLWKKRKLLLRSVRVELRTQYAGTIFGLFWIILGPLLLLALYTIVYGVIFRIRAPNFTRAEYIINVFSGLVLFLAFAQALAVSATSMARDRKLLFSSFPAEFIPAKAVIVSYVMLIPATAFVILGDVVFSQPSWTLVWVPVVGVMQMLFTIGLGMMIALATLAIRDINFLIQYIVIALLIITPIAYTPDMIPDRIRPLLYLNPLYYFVSANQHLILLNRLPPLEEVLLGLAVTVLFFLGGIRAFQRGRAVVADFI